MPPLAAGWLAFAVLVIPPAQHLLGGVLGSAVAAACAAGALQAGTLTALLAAPGSGWRPRGGRAAMWLLAWCAAVAASAAAGGAWVLGVPVLAGLGTACAVLLLTAGWPAPAADILQRWFTRGLLAGASLASAVAVHEWAAGPGVSAGELGLLRTLDPHVADLVAARIGQGRAAAYFLYPNALAGLLILAIPAAAEGFGRGRRRPVYAGVAVLCSAGLLASGSIGGTACLVAAMAAVAARRSGTSRASPWAWAAGAALVLVAVVWARPAGSVADAVATKWGHWREVVRHGATAGTWLLGSGPGHYGESAGGLMAAGLRSRAAHNWLIEIWVEQGLAGALCWTGLSVALLAAWWRGAAGPGWGLAAGWLAGWLHALMDLDYALPGLSFPWWVMSGVLAASMPGRADGSRLPSMRLQRLSAGVRRLAARVPVRTALLLGGVWLTVATRGPAAALGFGMILGASMVIWLVGRLRRPVASPLVAPRDLPWLLLAGWAWGWVLVSDSPDAAARSALTVTGLMAVGALARSAMADRPVLLLERGLLGSALLLALVACWQGWTTGHPAPAVFPSPNFLGAFLLAGCGLLLGRLGMPVGGARAHSLRRTLLPWGGLAILVAGLAATGSSGAGIAALVLAGWWWVRRGGVGLRAAGLAVLVLVAGLVAIPRVDALSLVQRGVMWREALHLLRHAPFGAGPGSYRDAVQAVQEASMTSAGIGRYSLLAEFAHCDPLQFAVEWGLPAFGFLAWGLTVLAVSAGGGASAGWRWCLAGLALHSLVDFPFRAPALALLGAIALGIGSRGGEGARRRPAAGPGDTGAVRGARLAVAVACLAAVAWVRPPLARRLAMAPAGPPAAELERARAIVAVWPLSAAGHLRAAEARVTVCLAIGSFQGAAAVEAAESFATAVLVGNGADGARMARGEFLLERAGRLRRPEDLGEAAAVFEAEAAHAPRRPQPWIGLARVALAAQAWRRADRCLAEAMRREPFALEALALRGLTAERGGDRRAARAWYRRALVLHAKAMQRPGLNPYERSLLDVDVSRIRGRLLDLGSG